MYTPSPQEVAVAFGLGAPDGELVHHRRGDTDAWRLETTTGSYFVKGYFPATGGQFNGAELTDQLAVAIEFERLALEAGVDMPEPVPPIDPVLGWLARIEDRLFRVHRWVEHGPAADVAVWLGRTMLQVHRLRPIGRSALPPWWRDAVRSPATWEAWSAKAVGHPWAALYREILSQLVEAAERVASLCEAVPDLVTTHGDFKPHNIVSSASGPVLVDWDSVRTDSAALEAARVAYIFGAGDRDRVARILAAYGDSGGELGWAGQDLFLSVVRNQLQVLGEHLQVALGETQAARWMGDRAAIEIAIGNSLRELPGRIGELRRLASGIGAG
ncbi:aminoglycoside phosphotransferase family protein [Kribbella sp.]|uniref:aminoglycoside phosphotransferase family protein n=1 Tax=Kribbella sp. TaxID=1871183 RepID=UPI002D22255F|nr:aminoglycoside phosphotransferase family protein [Kribbella sp.]HZX08726.1 aminoglycoside phosphotransferase family protein [Kribbella sp.]